MSKSTRTLFALLACALAVAARTPAVETQMPCCTVHALVNDCNQNGVDDSVDIALGSSCDTNADGVPDECQDGRREAR